MTSVANFIGFLVLAIINCDVSNGMHLDQGRLISAQIAIVNKKIEDQTQGLRPTLVRNQVLSPQTLIFFKNTSVEGEKKIISASNMSKQEFNEFLQRCGVVIKDDSELDSFVEFMINSSEQSLTMHDAGIKRFGAHHSDTRLRKMRRPISSKSSIIPPKIEGQTRGLTVTRRTLMLHKSPSAKTLISLAHTSAGSNARTFSATSIRNAICEVIKGKESNLESWRRSPSDPEYEDYWWPLFILIAHFDCVRGSENDITRFAGRKARSTRTRSNRMTTRNRGFRGGSRTHQTLPHESYCALGERCLSTGHISARPASAHDARRRGSASTVKASRRRTTSSSPRPGPPAARRRAPSIARP